MMDDLMSAARHALSAFPSCSVVLPFFLLLFAYAQVLFASLWTCFDSALPYSSCLRTTLSMPLMRELLTAPKKPQDAFISSGVRDLDNTGFKSWLNICLLVDYVKHQYRRVFFADWWGALRVILFCLETNNAVISQGGAGRSFAIDTRRLSSYTPWAGG